MPSEAARERLDGLLASLPGHRGVRHAVMAVTHGDGWHWSSAAGPTSPDGPAMTADTRVHLASVTKLFTATAVLQLVERGALGLDDPVTTWLPTELSVGLHRVDGVDHTANVTVRNLLAHTSGLPDYFLEAPAGDRSIGDLIVEQDVSFTIDDVVDRVRRLSPHFPPQHGTGRHRAHYSDTNFQLLAEIVARVTGRAFAHVVEERILGPLGLDSTAFAGRPRPTTPREPVASLWSGDVVLDRPRLMASLGPDGGLVGTVSDAIRFLRALLEGRLFDDPGTLTAMTGRWNRFGVPRSRTAIMSPSWPIQYGLGIKRIGVLRLQAPGRRPATLIGHTGASGSWLLHCPEHDLTLAGTVDQTLAASVPYRIGPRILRACT